MSTDKNVRNFAFWARLFANGFGLASLERILSEQKDPRESVETYAYHWAYARLQQEDITLEQLNTMTQSMIGILGFASLVEYSLA